MRYVALFLVCILFTSNAFAGEIDGKGLICTYKFKGKVSSYNALFNSGRVTRFWVIRRGLGVDWLKLNVTSKADSTYYTDEDYITWGKTDWEYKVNRKTLDIELKTNSVLPDGTPNQWSGKCRVTDRQGLEKELDREIEARKASLKKNKL